MATIRFYVKLLANNTLQVMALLQHGKQKPAAYLGYTLPANKLKEDYRYWDQTKQKAVEHDTASTINAKISKWRSRFDSYVDDCKRQIILPDMHEIKALLETDDPDAKPKGPLLYLLDAAKAHYQWALNNTAPGTSKQYKSFIEDIEAYEKKYRKVLLKKIDTDLLQQMGEFLIEHGDNHNRTINRKLGRVLTIMRHVGCKDIPQKYKFKELPPNRFALEPADMKLLWKYKTETNEDRLHLDAFLFSCETTLRHSDVLQLYPYHKKQMEVDGQIIHYLDLTQIKTVNKNEIVLNPRALKIWDRYAIGDLQVFPIVHASHATKDYIKRICKKAGLNRKVEIVKIQGKKVIKESAMLHEAISYHMSRNTAITTQLQKLPAALVMQNAGIKKMDTLLGYNKDQLKHRLLQTLKATK